MSATLSMFQDRDMPDDIAGFELTHSQGLSWFYELGCNQVVIEKIDDDTYRVSSHIVVSGGSSIDDIFETVEPVDKTEEMIEYLRNNQDEFTYDCQNQGDQV